MIRPLSTGSKKSEIALDAFQKNASFSIIDVMAAHGVTLTGHGAEMKGRCPFHEDKTPSLSVNREKGLWNCFGCGASGNVETFLRRVDGERIPPLRVGECKWQMALSASP